MVKNKKARKSQYMRYISALILVSVIAAGCKGKGSTAPAPDIVAKGDPIELVATSQILPPEKIVRASIAPKPGFMASLGHILLLSEQGTIFSANTGFGTVTKVAEGNFTEILGLNRGDAASLFLTLDRAGSIKAFQENNSEGFDPITISSSELTADVFCQPETSAENKAHIIAEGSLRELNYTVSNSEVIEFKITELETVGDAKNCFVNSKGHIFVADNTGQFRSIGDHNISVPSRITQITTVGDNLNLLQDTPGKLYAQTVDGNAPIQLKAGFSIPGVETADWVLATNSPMGNTFMGGLTLISDRSDNRIAMISNDYLRKNIVELDTAPNP